MLRQEGSSLPRAEAGLDQIMEPEQLVDFNKIVERSKAEGLKKRVRALSPPKLSLSA